MFLNIYSLGTGDLIDKINQTSRDSVDAHLAALNGRDYVLTMEGGAKLKVYKIPKQKR